MKPGLILFAHGARDPRWATPFDEIARRVRAERPDLEVRLAYLELMAPDLPTAGDELAAAGCTQVSVVPMFLGTGGHVRRDLPQLLDRIRDAHPQLQVAAGPPIGEIDSVMQAMVAAAAAACDEGGGR